MPLANPRKNKLPKKETVIRPTALAAIRHPPILPQPLPHRPIVHRLKIIHPARIVHRMMKRVVVEKIASASAIKYAMAAVKAKAVVPRTRRAAVVKAKAAKARKVVKVKTRKNITTTAITKVKIKIVENAAVEKVMVTDTVTSTAKVPQNRAKVPAAAAPVPKPPKAAAAFPKVPAPAPVPVPAPAPAPARRQLWNAKKAPSKVNRSTSSIIPRKSRDVPHPNVIAPAFAKEERKVVKAVVVPRTRRVVEERAKVVKARKVVKAITTMEITTVKRKDKKNDFNNGKKVKDHFFLTIDFFLGNLIGFCLFRFS